jgi:hypothetical protein
VPAGVVLRQHSVPAHHLMLTASFLPLPLLLLLLPLLLLRAGVV